MSSIPEVERILNQIRTIHSKKNEDYSANSKPFENFDRSTEIMSWFEYNGHKSFVWPIATKLARLATLLNSKKKPNNESIEDSFLDLVTYCVLWWAFYKRNFTNKPIESEASDSQPLHSLGSNLYDYYCKQCGKGFNTQPFVIVLPHSGIECLFDTDACRQQYMDAH